MPLMMGKLYAALKAANAPETEAREAAEEAALDFNRLGNLDRGLEGVNARIDLLRTEVTGEIAALRTELISGAAEGGRLEGWARAPISHVAVLRDGASPYGASRLLRTRSSRRHTEYFCHDQAASTPDALAAWVAIASISGGDSASYGSRLSCFSRLRIPAI